MQLWCNQNEHGSFSDSGYKLARVLWVHYISKVSSAAFLPVQNISASNPTNATCCRRIVRAGVRVCGHLDHDPEEEQPAGFGSACISSCQVCLCPSACLPAARALHMGSISESTELAVVGMTAHSSPSGGQANPGDQALPSVLLPRSVAPVAQCSACSFDDVVRWRCSDVIWPGWRGLVLCFPQLAHPRLHVRALAPRQPCAALCLFT